jgi:hypothetical protein
MKTMVKLSYTCLGYYPSEHTEYPIPFLTSGPGHWCAWLNIFQSLEFKCYELQGFHGNKQ